MQTHSLQIDPAQAGTRLDKAIAAMLPMHSRAAIQKCLKDGLARVDGATVEKFAKFIVDGGERVEVAVPSLQQAECPAQEIPLDVVHRDDDILVLNKPPGLSMHPGAGQQDGTLVNALLHYDPASRAMPRAGLVHRLDKDTSGLLVVARNEEARLNLIAQLAARTVKREYLAVVHGVLAAGMRIDAPIGRHRRDRRKMSIRPDGRPAVTHVRVAQKFGAHSLLHVELESGRTHQIRVHLSANGYPLVGDKKYRGRMLFPPRCSKELRTLLHAFSRQALHATRLALQHPVGGERMEWEREAPEDFLRLVEGLGEGCSG